MYIWFFFYYFISRYNERVQQMYWIFERPTALFSRGFSDLGYLEKVFLALFYRDTYFAYSVANIYKKSDIYDHRRKNYPVLHVYHSFFDKVDFFFEDLNFVFNQYNYFKKSRLCKKKYAVTVGYFFTTKSAQKSFKFIKFLALQKVFFLKYSNGVDHEYFEYFDTYNMVLFNFVFFAYLRKCRCMTFHFDLEYYVDWYTYMFDKRLTRKKKKLTFSRWNLNFKKKLKLQRIYNFWKFLYHYHLSYKLMKFWLSLKFNTSKAMKNTLRIKPKIEIGKLFKSFHKLIYPIRFKNSSNVKNVRYDDIKNYVFFYLRKNRIFNKGRYSRNRQLYRTGVYWCLWLNVMVVYGLYFLFYRFSFNFGYIWIGMFFLILSTIFGRMFKYNFFNIFYLYEEAVNLKNWLSLMILNFIEVWQYISFKIFGDCSVLLYFFKKRKPFYKQNEVNDILLYLLEKIDHFFYLVWKSKKVYAWEYMGHDDSFLKYKTFFHWCKQIYRSITI